MIERGELVLCARCGRRILTADDMHLGHDDTDRTITRGAECAACNNLSAAGRSGHATTKEG